MKEPKFQVGDKVKMWTYWDNYSPQFYYVVILKIGKTLKGYVYLTHSLKGKEVIYQESGLLKMQDIVKNFQWNDRIAGAKFKAGDKMGIVETVITIIFVANIENKFVYLTKSSLSKEQIFTEKALLEFIEEEREIMDNYLSTPEIWMDDDEYQNVFGEPKDPSS